MATDFLNFDKGAQAIVTGAASGIGEATARLLCAQGLTVIGLDIDGERLSALDMGDRFHPMVADTGKPDAIEAMFGELAERFGPIGHLVNNAGPPSALPLTIEEGLAQTAGSVQRMTAAWEAGLPATAEQASVVNVASVAGVASGGPPPSLISGRGGAADNGWYPTGKAAVTGLTRWQAVSSAGKYRANAVAPGITMTPRLGDITGGAYGRDVLARTPVGRLATAPEVANAIVYLLSPAASYVNGQTLIVDGGGTLAF
ncbi:SDR family NAD(P)-dependent oxidoreductase [Parasphingorhabdus sp.]|uniref:SDR family NAD(P)-dependent oxidoreductase n=1 Tax=Parasphingorhabdus sp. TaxID=2709688 RepID=UPI003A95C15A